MSHSAADTPFSPALQGTLAWLGQPPAQDPLRDLVPLRNHLAALAGDNLSPISLLKVLDLFQLRADAITNVLEPLLLDATLPLPRRLRTVAKGLIEIHRPLAEGYLRVFREASPAQLAPLKRSQSQVGAAAMSNLARRYQVALMVAAPAPIDLWKHSQEILRRLTPACGIEIMDVERGHVAATGLPLSTVALDRIGSQLTREHRERYIAKPYAVRVALPERMPHLNVAPEEARALAAHLSTVMVDDALEAVVPVDAPTVAQGKELFGKHGCVSCHIAGEKGGYVGPELNGSCARLKAGWTVTFLLEPERWKPGTLQPDHGLTRPEAEALTAYVLSLPARKAKGR